MDQNPSLGIQTGWLRLLSSSGVLRFNSVTAFRVKESSRLLLNAKMTEAEWEIWCIHFNQKSSLNETARKELDPVYQENLKGTDCLGLGEQAIKVACTEAMLHCIRSSTCFLDGSWIFDFSNGKESAYFGMGKIHPIKDIYHPALCFLFSPCSSRFGFGP
ncbi:hypothetical protein VNO77_04700 [Canavalia gladiata]|uniref:Uncharacterized protein n=1 Tax=Canavalia gladiata TaxID=3824 RepID=A0AAN9RDG3_CANGL